MTNPFNCPPSLDNAMQTGAYPMLNNVEKLGSFRCQWLGNPHAVNNCADDDTPSAWSLDGVRATPRQIRKAAP